MSLKWGIASAGNISFDFVNALQILPRSEHEVVAVAARDLGRATKFSEKFNIPVSYGSYKELANNKDIDCVYIGSIHTQHCALSELFMTAGKHVVCEKPMSINSTQCKKTLNLAKISDVFFLEGFWSRFSPVYSELRSELEDGCIGEIRLIQVNFGANVPPTADKERFTNKALGGGVLLDLGCYPIQFAQFIFREDPIKVTSTACMSKSGVDESVVTTLTYSGNRMAVLTCSFGCELDQTASLFGTKGQIKLPNFWNPEYLTTSKKSYSYPLPKGSFPMIFKRSEGFIYEIEEVKKCIKKGLKESPLMTHAESLQISEISDEIRRQCGIVYDADNAL